MNARPQQNKQQPNHRGTTQLLGHDTEVGKKECVTTVMKVKENPSYTTEAPGGMWSQCPKFSLMYQNIRECCGQCHTWPPFLPRPQKKPDSCFHFWGDWWHLWTARTTNHRDERLVHQPTHFSAEMLSYSHADEIKKCQLKQKLFASSGNSTLCNILSIWLWNIQVLFFFPGNS